MIDPESKADQKKPMSGLFPISITEICVPITKSQEPTKHLIVEDKVGNASGEIGPKTQADKPHVITPSAPKIVQNLIDEIVSPPKKAPKIGRAITLRSASNSVDQPCIPQQGSIHTDAHSLRLFTAIRKNLLMPHVCILARESFRIENKPKQVILPTGYTSANTSVFEQGTDAIRKKEPSSISGFQIPKKPLVSRYKLGGLSCRRPSENYCTISESSTTRLGGLHL